MVLLKCTIFTICPQGRALCLCWQDPEILYGFQLMNVETEIVSVTHKKHIPVYIFWACVCIYHFPV